MHSRLSLSLTSLFILLSLFPFANHNVNASTNTILLSGTGLSLQEICRIANGAPVEIAPEALKRMSESHELIMSFAASGQPVYGLTVGVGANKDKAVTQEKATLSKKSLELSREFNRRALRAHCAGAGPNFSREMVRAAMAIRCNTMLLGQSGAQPKVAKLYASFLNAGITPVVPSRGSIGQADITLAPHVGLVMMGEWFADMGGKRVPSDQALSRAGLKPLDPVGKDALAILSTNAFSAARGIQALTRAEQLLKILPLVIGLSLEGLNGNIAPFTERAAALRPFPFCVQAAQSIRSSIKGSYLWEPDPDRPLQDPLSYRTAGFTLGNALNALAQARKMLRLQINTPDDNPAVILDKEQYPHHRPDSGQLRKYHLTTDTVSGMVIPTANFDPLSFVLALENLSLALSHVSRESTLRTIKLADPRFTDLPRFLAPDEKALTFAAIQKPLISLNTAVRRLADPVSPDGLPAAMDIEDTSTNALLAASRLKKIVNNIFSVLGLELLHAAQAVDLRLRRKPGLALGSSTLPLFKAYRDKVSFVNQDRQFTQDIEVSGVFLQTWSQKTPLF